MAITIIFKVMKTEFYIRPLSFPLNQWVQFVWISKGENDTTKSKILPNGAIELILNFGDKQKTLKEGTLKTDRYFTKYWVAGLQSKPIIIQSLSDTNLIGIRFLPGGAYPFFKSPVSELSDKVVEANWMKKELNELRKTIGNLSDLDKITTLVTDYLLKKFDDTVLSNEAVMYVAREIFLSENEVSIDKLVKKAGYSHKHFLSLFKKQVGTSPKNLQRIARLQRIIQMVKAKPEIKWTDILYQFSFYDPAHFNHDFRDMTGMTPEQYMSNRTFDENHCVIR